MFIPCTFSLPIRYGIYRFTIVSGFPVNPSRMTAAHFSLQGTTMGVSYRLSHPKIWNVVMLILHGPIVPIPETLYHLKPFAGYRLWIQQVSPRQTPYRRLVTRNQHAWIGITEDTVNYVGAPTIPGKPRHKLQDLKRTTAAILDRLTRLQDTS